MGISSTYRSHFEQMERDVKRSLRQHTSEVSYYWRDKTRQEAATTKRAAARSTWRSRVVATAAGVLSIFLEWRDFEGGQPARRFARAVSLFDQLFEAVRASFSIWGV